MTSSTPKYRKSQFEEFRNSLDDFMQEVRDTTFEDQKKSSVKEDTQEDRRTPRRTGERTGGHPKEQENGQESRQPTGHSKEHPKGQASGHKREHDNNFIEDKQIKDPVFWIQDNYAKVLDYLISKQSRVTQLKEIASITDVPYGTVRKAIRCLFENGFITKPCPYRKGKIRGITYNINEDLCNRYICTRCSEHLIEQSTEHPREHSSERAVNRTPKGTPSYNSSSSSLKKTTTITDLESILASHPELGYWRQKGLTPKQIMEWIKAADCEPELMFQYLCFCRYEMIDLNLEESKPVNNVFNWFFKILEKTGCYPKPKGYKSHEEKQLETEREMIAKQEKQIQELKKLHRKKYEQEQDIEFWQMMNDPDNDLYRQCFERLNDFAKAKARKGGKIFESAMRKAFDEIEEISDLKKL